MADDIEAVPDATNTLDDKTAALLSNQPQPAVIDEQLGAPFSLSALRVSDPELADYENESGEQANSTTATNAQGVPSGGSRAWQGPHLAARNKKGNDDVKKWDIFLSYRVSADQDLVKELYWQLCHRTVVAGGKERKLRVFWDRECLKTGERWEEGFADAICSCHLVVLVMSRATFVMDGSHNVTELTEDSRCDNVLLEYNLALELDKLNNTAIMPLFVGDKDGSGQYTHFFQSGCMPALKEDVVVRQISEKVEGYLEHNAGVAHEKMPPRQSVKAVLHSVTQFQGHFLQGNAYEAVKGAAQSVYECAVRLVAEQRARRAVEHFKFLTPQGMQVYEWLADNRLLQFAPIFAKNRLDSLRKVSRLTYEEVVEINKELYARQQREEGAVEQQHGTRVALGDSIERLKGDPRTKTIQEQMENYNDSKVSVLNLLGSQNQSGAVLGKKSWVLIWGIFWALFTIWCLRDLID